MDHHRPSGDYGDRLGTTDPRDTLIQIVLSLVLGIGGFAVFCVRIPLRWLPTALLVSTNSSLTQIIRPRWTTLYAARKKQLGEVSPLPELPSSLLGWVPALWRITEQQVLASAGLDAYVVSSDGRCDEGSNFDVPCSSWRSSVWQSSSWPLLCSLASF